MSSPSVELVHLPGASRAEVRREVRRRRREHRARVAVCAAAAGVLLAGAAVYLWPERSSGAADTVVAVEDTAPPVMPPPPSPPVALTDPKTATTPTPWEVWPVELPGWKGDGWLVTDGRHAPRLVPGGQGQAVIAVPADPTAAATVNAGGRQWWVIERGAVPEGTEGLARLVNANPQVPTVALVSSLPAPSRAYVVAR